MKAFFVWISVLTVAYEKRLSSELVSKGYTIGPAGKDNLIIDGCIAYKIQHDSKELEEVEADIADIIHRNDIRYHLLLVVRGNFTSRWRGSNINLNPISKEEKEIEDTMAQINKLLSSYSSPPLTDEEKKRLIQKRKNS